MAIKFGQGRPEDKPSQAVIDLLKEAGYRWNPADRIWAHTVRSDSAMSTRIEAEWLYQEIRQMIRQYAVKQDGRYVLSTLGFNLVELEYFVNHSTKPNLTFDDSAGCYVTARVIRSGEELTGDYNHFAPRMPTIRYRR